MNAPADRLTAALRDRYRIERELGQGGMATVYLAHDIKHDRKVAIKVLRPELAATMGAERFEREIQVAARLTHPHILGVLDSGEADGFFYYVMPYVEGETLRERIARSGELPVSDTLRLLGEITEALGVAHKAGVVHRDIKPENILLSGRHALVMDFGVAKAVTEASGRQQLTTAGVALGTPAYMAPEQATADPQLDYRVDIYALGVLAYEMLTGHPPFHGLTPQATLAAHVTQAPTPVLQRRPGLSPALDTLVMRCLAKRPADRFQSAEDLGAALEPLATPSGGMTPAHTVPVAAVTPTRSTSPRWIKGALAAVVVLAVGGGAFVLLRRPPATAALMQPVQLTRSAGIQESPFITADGKGVAYRILSPGDSANRVELRRGTDGSAVPLATAAAPVGWSPDGDKFLLRTPRGLETVPALGGTSTLLVAGAQHGAWSPDGQRLAYVRGDSVLLRGSNGESTLLAKTLDPHSLAWSPDGRWIAYVSDNSRYLRDWNVAVSSLWLVPSAGGEAIQLTPPGAMNLSPAWAPDSRRLLFVSGRSGTRDIYQLNLGSDGRPRGEPIQVTVGLNVSQISLAPDGEHLAYSVVINHSNIWRVKAPAASSVSSRDAELVTTDEESIEGFAISPDGQWLVFDSDRSGIPQIFRRKLAGGEVQQVTRGPSPAFSASMSPDGRQVAYHAMVNGLRRVFVGSSDGSDQPVQVSPGALPDERNPRWSPDGTRLAWNAYERGAPLQAWLVTRTGGGWSTPREVAYPNAIVAAMWGDTSHLIAADTLNRRGLLVSVDGASGPPRLLLQVTPATPRTTGVPVPSVDLRTVYFGSGQGIWSMPMAGGTERQVVRFDDPLHPHVVVAQSIAGFGGYVYFTLQDPQSHIWTARVTGLAK